MILRSVVCGGGVCDPWPPKQRPPNPPTHLSLLSVASSKFFPGAIRTTRFVGYSAGGSGFTGAGAGPPARLLLLVVVVVVVVGSVPGRASSCWMRAASACASLASQLPCGGECNNKVSGK